MTNKTEESVFSFLSKAAYEQITSTEPNTIARIHRVNSMNRIPILPVTFVFASL